MLYDMHGSETRKALAIISAGARAWTAADLGMVVSACASVMPYGFLEHQIRQRKRYVGDQADILRDELKRAYPDAFDASGNSSFALNPVRYLSFFAAQDAGNYVQPATRALVDDATGEELEPEDPRVEEMETRLRSMGVDVVMAEGERRSIAVEQAIVNIYWHKARANDPGEMRARLWWPEDVRALAHPSAPDDDDSIIIFMVKEATPRGMPQKWWVWSRASIEDDAGRMVGFGPWFHVHVDESGAHASLSEQYAGEVLPFAFLRLTDPNGSLWVDNDRDTGLIVDALNRMRANLQLVVDMQGHDQYVYSGTMHDEATLRMGADKVVRVGPNERLESVSTAPKIVEIQNVQASFLREVATTRRQNPDSYSASTNQQASGVARMIANAPHDAAVREARHMLKRFEERRLWPIVLEVGDLFGPTPIGQGVSMRVTHATPPVYEEPEAKQRRLSNDLDLDVITKARYAVEMGYYSSIADAKEAGLSDEFRDTAPTPGMPAPATPQVETSVVDPTSTDHPADPSMTPDVPNAGG